ncbi:uncharacterized protein LOC121411992 [Lytechinus variegatus]|uniref:uncharacterized protein LOC121411992 n=1 Tax=Lytechinus variegatus TaxID=7654 RepID=UPI001BB21518|nr:uncharacterized protein LOC121411992 [Lytechinus variegatus]
MGDFNRLNIVPLLQGHGLKQVVNKSTCNDAILDKIITNLDSFYAPITLLSPIGRSDHNGVLWSPDSNHLKPPNKTQRKVIRPMRDSDVRQFGQWISSHDWSNVRDAGNVDAKCNEFYSDLNAAIDRFFPAKTIQVHSRDKLWVTPRIKALIKKRQAAFAKRSSDWHRLRNKVQREIREAKKKYYRDRVQRLKKQNPRAWYQFIKLQTSTSAPSITLDIPGLEPSDHQGIANAINDHFVNISIDIPRLDRDSLPTCFPCRPQDFPSVQPWNIYKYLKKVKPGKSCGPDGISTKLIQEFAVEFSVPITYIVNASLQEGTVPRQWKRSIVVPIPKESPANELTKLRPISLTDHFSKLVELVVYRLALGDIAHNIDSQQFGSRSNMSTAHYPVNLMEYVHATRTSSVTSRHLCSRTSPKRSILSNTTWQLTDCIAWVFVRR